MTTTNTYKHAIRLLTRQDYSEYKLRTKLSAKQFPLNDIDDAIEILTNQKYLRDEFYAESRIKVLIRNNYGPSYIEQKLKQEHLKTSGQQILDVYDEMRITIKSQIDNLIQKKIPTRIPEDHKEREKIKIKIYNFLYSKGHSTEDVSLPF